MAAKIVEGRKAPDFSLTDAKGERVSLADLKGKNVVVYFYPKDDTPGCTKEACGFRDHWKALQKAGIVVLGVSADDAASHAKFAAKYKLPFPLLSDPERKVMTAWGAYGDNDDVRQEDQGGDPLDGVDRSRRDGAQALGPGGRRREAPGAGARGGPRRRVSAAPVSS